MREASAFLDNYRRAYFELHELLVKTDEFHAQGIGIFSGLRDKFAAMPPELTEKLFFLLLDHYTIADNAFHILDIAAVREAINITEMNYQRGHRHQI